MGLQEGFKELKIATVNQLINIELCKFFYKLAHKKLPINLMDCVLSDSKGLLKSNKYGTRKNYLPNLPIARDWQYKRSFLTCSNVLYNELPDIVRVTHTSIFCTKSKRIPSAQTLDNSVTKVQYS